MSLDNSNIIKCNITVKEKDDSYVSQNSMTYREVFERGLRRAKHNARNAATFGFRSDSLVNAMVEALNILGANGMVNSEEAVYMFEDALVYVGVARGELEASHVRKCAKLKELIEEEEYTSVTDICYIEAVKEIEKYCKRHAVHIHYILDAYEKIFKIVGANKLWMPVIDKIIYEVEEFSQKIYGGFELLDNEIITIEGSERAALMLSEFKEIKELMNNRVAIEEERLIRQRAEERELLRRQQEEAFKKQKEEEEAKLIRQQEETRLKEEEEKEYKELVATNEARIEYINTQKATAANEYETLRESLMGKVKEQEQDEEFFNKLSNARDALTGQIDNVKKEKSIKLDKLARLGVLAVNEKKKLKLEIGRLDNELYKMDEKLKSYNTSLDSVERRIKSRDATGKNKLLAFEQRIKEYDEEINQLKQQIIDKKPAHMN